VQPPFKAKKSGKVLHLEQDPHPETTDYVVVETAGMLVLFSENARIPALNENLEVGDVENEPTDRDEHLLRAFTALEARIRPSEWTRSSAPFRDLEDCFRSLAAQQRVVDDVAQYLRANPVLENSIEMLFTSISMSARARWSAAPEHIRGVVARGWFLGRWLPTFLVLDGPIQRFLKSKAFSRQNEPASSMLKAVRSFFDTKEFMLLRHAFAHWSFRWEVINGDSVIIGTNDANVENVRVRRAEADAFHIITFALIEVLNDVFLRPHRSG
jgi:hypothetical protein